MAWVSVFEYPRDPSMAEKKRNPLNDNGWWWAALLPVWPEIILAYSIKLLQVKRYRLFQPAYGIFCKPHGYGLWLFVVPGFTKVTFPELVMAKQLCPHRCYCCLKPHLSDIASRRAQGNDSLGEWKNRVSYNMVTEQDWRLNLEISGFILDLSFFWKIGATVFSLFKHKDYNDLT